MNFKKDIEERIAKMSLKEKIGQLTQYMFSVKDIETLKKKASAGKIGSIVLSSTAFAGNDEQEKLAHACIDEIQKCALGSPSGVPILFGRDVIHGHKVVFPVPLAMSAAFNPELVEECYECIAEEALYDGVRWSFSPMLDVSRDPRWGRCIESPGEDPYLGECMAKAVVNGFQNSGKIAACAKHYIGYGASEGGRDYHRTEISDYTLRNYYLKAFKSAVDNNVAAVMSSFNDVSGQPVTASKYLITDVLKKELKFDGFVVTDWAAIEQLERQGVSESRKMSAELAMNAGIDMDMCDFCYEEYLEELIAEGKISIDAIDEAVKRILKVKFEYRLFEKPYTKNGSINLDKHLEKSCEIAGESIVLLKNNGILPLKNGTTVSAIGPMLFERRSLLGSWTLDGEIELTPSMCECLEKEDDINFIMPDSRLDDEMIAVIRKSDVVIACLGESHKVTGEMHSLSDINIPKAQIELVKTTHNLGKPVVGVMMFGRPRGMEEIEPYLDAILYSWHTGTMQAKAVCDILLGRVNPSGRLPMTMPRRTGQIPIYYNATSSGRMVNGYYGEEMYQNYDDCKGSPMYQFGYGLSYTEFEYSDIVADETEISTEELERGKKIGLSVSVKNDGKYDGKEVVQLYVNDVTASMMRPMRELKSFKKVLIKSGEVATLAFAVGKQELGFYGADGIFRVEPGKFRIFVGSSCYANDFIEINVK